MKSFFLCKKKNRSTQEFWNRISHHQKLKKRNLMLLAFPWMVVESSWMQPWDDVMHSILWSLRIVFNNWMRSWSSLLSPAKPVDDGWTQLDAANARRIFRQLFTNIFQQSQKDEYTWILVSIHGEEYIATQPRSFSKINSCFHVGKNFDFLTCWRLK